MNVNDSKKTVQYNKGNNISPVGFIFACPGQKEQAAQKVVSGSTGNNLNLLISSLSGTSNSSVRLLFPTTDRYDYLITNASEIIHYPAHDGRSLPTRKEYMTERNIERLCDELKNLRLVIAFGVQAKEVAQAVEKAYKEKGVEQSPHFITSLPHLSFLSLNRIAVDVNGEPILRGDKDGTWKRIEVVRMALEKEIMAMNNEKKNNKE